MENEFNLDEIVNTNVCDPVDDLFTQEKFLKEKESCKTKQEQINFMYKYYSPNSTTPRRLARDYQFYTEDSRIDLRGA